MEQPQLAQNFASTAVAQLRPVMTFRVGVVAGPGVSIDLRKKIADALSAIKQALPAAADSAYASDPPVLRVVSTLAEGGARLFAEEALKLGYQLQAPLPFQRDEYKKDFTNDASRQVFDDLLAKATAVFEIEGDTDSAGKHLPAAYETIGHVVLDHSDLLIAIGDDIAKFTELAHRLRIPVVGFGIAGGADTFHAIDAAEPVPLKAGVYPGIVSGIVSPPWLSSRNPQDPDSNGSYLETARTDRPFLGRLWSWFVSFMGSGADLEVSVSPGVPPGDFKALFEHADAIANRFAGLYRGAFLSNYSLGLMAVFCALLGNADEEHAAVWLWGELAAILLVFWLIYSIHKKQWHFRSVDCRYFAEQLRILCYTYPLGLTSPPLHLPAHHLCIDVERSWMEWRLKALVRQQPLPSSYWSAARAAAYYRENVDSWAEGQRVYHSRNEKMLEKAEDRLSVLCWLFNGAAAVACIMHFGFHGPPTGPWLTLCAAGFPAAGGACHAIATQGEFRRLAARSGAMEKSWKAIRERLAGITQSGRLLPSTLRKESAAMAALMIEETVDWQVLYRKPVPPA
jgi:hypothetical protein